MLLKFRLNYANPIVGWCVCFCPPPPRTFFASAQRFANYGAYESFAGGGGLGHGARINGVAWGPDGSASPASIRARVRMQRADTWHGVGPGRPIRCEAIRCGQKVSSSPGLQTTCQIPTPRLFRKQKGIFDSQVGAKTNLIMRLSLVKQKAQS